MSAIAAQIYAKIFLFQVCLGGVSWTVGGVFAGFEALSAWQELL
jgi:hypothetical protein